MLLVFTVILVALIFTYTNGFHDTANSIATVVGTKVLTPRQAILLAAATNLIGAFFGTAVATTIASGLVDAQVATMPVLCCARPFRHGNNQRFARSVRRRPAPSGTT